MSETSGPNSNDIATGWVRVDRAGWWDTFAATPANGLLLAIVPLQVGSFVARGLEISLWWGLLISLGVMLPVTLVLYFVQRLRYLQPWVNFDTGQLRAGRRTVPLADIVWARLDLFDQRRRRNRMLTLRFGADGGPRASVRLRGRTGRTPAASVTDVLAHIVRRSSITVPQTPDDPSARFARYNFPGFLSRDDALDVVLNPPTIDDPAPVL
ncbi:hypothetical protein [Cryobacterium sp. PH29-G1]|uniref:hypothetical protein n=1 Tax=Cryobacterium sp. PH29-G1 TaxID=3046211 RepID=UPI0024BA8049|nr:hypothetical protein [Cryobacterium sp. PH29-G1]MDJ0350306.1 hypothetical protein [Cryobacterium sp. PH29-G1]